MRCATTGNGGVCRRFPSRERAWRASASVINMMSSPSGRGAEQKCVLGLDASHRVPRSSTVRGLARHTTGIRDFLPFRPVRGVVCFTSSPKRGPPLPRCTGPLSRGERNQAGAGWSALTLAVIVRLNPARHLLSAISAVPRSDWRPILDQDLPSLLSCWTGREKRANNLPFTSG